MPEIAHPDTGESIEVQIVDTESHRGEDFVAVEAVEDGVELDDGDGHQPWLHAEEVTRGMAQTPENAVALADGRTPEEADELREEVQD